MTQPHSKPIRLAHAALFAGIDNQWSKASRYIQRINDECGPDSLPYALMTWCDAIAEHAMDGFPADRKIRVKGMEYETGAIVDEVPARIRWAQDVVKARGEMDEAAFTAAVDELGQIDDAKERGSYVGAVLEAAALSIRGLPRGYAVMGRS